MKSQNQELSKVIFEVESLFNQFEKYLAINEVRMIFGLDNNFLINDKKFLKILLFCLVSKKGKTFDLLDYFGFDQMEEYISLLSKMNFIRLHNSSSMSYTTEVSVNSLAKKIRDAISQEAKFRSELSKKLNIFKNTNEYDYILKFAKRFGSEAEIPELEKLSKILGNKKLYFTLRELKTIITLEISNQDNQNIKSKILFDNPQTRKEILISYLNFYSENDEKTSNNLIDILQEKGYQFSNINNLRTELKNLSEELELLRFEERLFNAEEELKVEDIDLLDGYQFEDFLKDLYLKMGYDVEPTRLSGDQGADLVVVKFGEKTVIQAKCYSGKVGNKAVQEILASMSLYQAQKGAVITNNYYTPATFELAEANNIELIDRDGLEKLIKTYW